MNQPPDTDLRAYSGRALLVAAAVSSSLHVALALVAPEWGGGRGLPMLRRPPLVVRMEMLSGIRSEPIKLQENQEDAENRGQGSGGRGQEKKNQGMRNEDRGRGGPDPAIGFSPTPDTRHPTPVFVDPADGEEKGLLLAAQRGEGADSLAFAGGGAAGNLPLSPSPALPVGGEDVGGAEALEMWQVEEPPKQVAFVEPEYPALARRMGVEGSVVIRYLVGQDGRVEQMAVLEGPELLREASLRAVGQFIYEPVYHRGRRTRVWMRQVITFRLE